MSFTTPPPSSTALTWQDIVNLITAQGQSSGLSQDQINAAITVAKVENGWSGAIGDSGTSFGVFQFHIGGVLNSFAQWLEQPFTTSAQQQAVGQYAIANPAQAIDFALGPNGYLAQAIKNGTAAGYSGAGLAQYAEQNGQRAQWSSSVAQRVADAYSSLFGSGTGSTVPPPTSGTATTDTTTTPTAAATSPWQSVLDFLTGKNKPTTFGSTDVGQGLGALSDNLKAITEAFTAAWNDLTRFFWILLGVLIALVGIYLLVHSND